jgi:FkbM family methyltransferase
LGTPLSKTYIAIGFGKPWRSHSLDGDSGPENRAVIEHHRIFRNAELWSGRIADHIDVDFLGAREDKQFFLLEWRDVERDFSKTHDQWANLPEFSEEYFEWIDLLAAVKTAKDRFVMMELGAGYGRWLMRAAAAIKRYNPIPFMLIGVEGEPIHVEWMKLNFRNNGLNSDAHRVLHAAIGESSGTAYFPVGDPHGWGQFILDDDKPGPQKSRHSGIAYDEQFLAQLAPVRLVTIEEAAAGEQLIDFIDMDIQGAEAAVMAQAIDFCSNRVRIIHIGTHSRLLEDRVRDIFRKAGWLPRFDFPNFSNTPTEYGTLAFYDGVQSWANPRFADRLVAADLMDSPMAMLTAMRRASSCLGRFV